MTYIADCQYQCDRCMRLMQKPSLGQGPAAGATKHYCLLCSIVVLDEAKRNQVQPGHTPQ